jgi:Na+/H+ antiporter NhaC
MKARHLLYSVAAYTAICLIFFWLTRYSVFDEQVSLRYEDWARGAAAEYNNELSAASRFWLIMSLLGLAFLLLYTIRYLVSDVAQVPKK